MPRIYYREKKLHDVPLKNEVITVELFDKIIALSAFIPEDALQIFELPQKKSTFAFWKNDKPFKHAVGIPKSPTKPMNTVISTSLKPSFSSM